MKLARKTLTWLYQSPRGMRWRGTTTGRCRVSLPNCYKSYPLSCIRLSLASDILRSTQSVLNTSAAAAIPRIQWHSVKYISAATAILKSASSLHDSIKLQQITVQKFQPRIDSKYTIIKSFIQVTRLGIAAMTDMQPALHHSYYFICLVLATGVYNLISLQFLIA